MRNKLPTLTTAQNDGLLLPSGGMTIDSEKKALRFHNGQAVGGFEVLGTQAVELPPGPPTLQAGNSSLGYYGYFDDNSFLTRSQVISATGISEGSGVSGGNNWFKFAYQNKLLYLAERPLRSGISFGAIYNAGAVFGVSSRGFAPFPNSASVPQNAQIAFNDFNFRIRLLRNGEWEALVYRIVNTGPLANTWDSFTLSTLLISNGSYGSASWIQERDSAVIDFNGDNNRLLRGYPSSSDVTRTWSTVGFSTNNFTGWRPVLELIE